MTPLQEFRVCELYTNDQIRFSLGLENLGGIRPSVDPQKSLRHVAILTVAEEAGRNRSENPYSDRIEGDVLTYTAQGREGDQQLTGRNKRLLEAAWLQSFDDRFIFHSYETDQERHVGNAVPPLLAEALARHFGALIQSA